MNCRSCGTSLPQGVAYCPSCGTTTPYNTNSQGGSSPYDPTYASSYGAPQGSAGGMPATGYGAEPFGGYAQPQDPYNAPPPSYGAPGASSTANPYAGSAGPASLPSTGYGTGGYGGQQSYAPVQQPGVFAPPAQPRRGKAGLIVAIIFVVLLLGGGVVLFSRHSGTGGSTTVVGTATTAPAVAPGGPSGQTIVPSAAGIITYPHTTSAVDNNYEPTQITNTFKAKQTIYVTFRIASNNQPGYLGAKWYADKQLVTSDNFHHSPENDVGYFSTSYDVPTKNGAVEVYWCTKSDCSDGQLAQVLTFTVTAATARVAPVQSRFDMAFRRQQVSV